MQTLLAELNVKSLHNPRGVELPTAINLAIPAQDLPEGFQLDCLSVVLSKGEALAGNAICFQLTDVELDSSGLRCRLFMNGNEFFIEGGRILVLADSDAKPLPFEPLIKKGDKGPQHRFIENPFYKVETLPSSGQIWHMWNKLGSNRSWHHNEWTENIDRGGDPCHWAPNCWVAHPDRISNGYEFIDGGTVDLIDWHYVFGWENPHTVICEGPLFTEIRRSGVIWPHPDHSRKEIERDDVPRLQAEVTYLFFPDKPYILQSSKMEVLKDINVFFIRNSQFVFLHDVFTHLFLMPDATGLKATDAPLPSCLRLMGECNMKPFDQMQHSLANILPSKLDYYAYFNEKTNDGFALFQLEEKNTNRFTGKATLYNHCNLLTEVYEWATYIGRTFAYTNQRFNPENVSPIPKGEIYVDQNVLLPFRYEGFTKMKQSLEKYSKIFTKR